MLQRRMGRGEIDFASTAHVVGHRCCGSDVGAGLQGGRGGNEITEPLTPKGRQSRVLTNRGATDGDAQYTTSGYGN